MGYINKEDIPQEEKSLDEQLIILDTAVNVARIDWRYSHRDEGKAFEQKYKDEMKRIYDRAVLALQEFKNLYPEVQVWQLKKHLLDTKNF